MVAIVLLLIGIIVGVICVASIKEKRRLAGLASAIGLVVILFICSITFVPAGHVGIIDVFGNVSDKMLKPGVSTVNPFANVVKLSIRTQEMKEVMEIPSKEGLTISLDISVLYQLDGTRAVNTYKTIGPDYQDIVLTPQLRAVARGITVGHEAKALYTSEREVLAQDIFDSLKGMVADRGVIVERVLLRSITLPKTLGRAIEEKLKAEQQAEQMRWVLLKEEQEAERKRLEAAGIRDAQTIIDESLTAQYLQYLWINTLNQNPNVIYVATEANMPVFRTVSDGNK